MLINFNQQFRLRTNELNIIINYFNSSNRNLFTNQNWFSNWSNYNNFANIYIGLVGIYYAKYEGLNTLKAGFSQLK